jgi:hypothetical protein
VRFVDLLRSAVLLSAAAATVLAVITVVLAGSRDDDLLGLAAAGWWLAALLIGARIGRRSSVSPAIGRLLREARTATSLPELHAGRVLVNRLWPLLLVTVVAAAAALAWPQVAAIAAGFGIMWSLSWRRQDAAVTAIEERDGVSFYVAHSSPLQPMRLVRAPGFRRDLPPRPDGAA